MANSTKISNTSIIESGDQGFQGFIRQDLMTATTVPGSPAAGTFYSSITNRASMQDLSKNLKVQMGIERIATESSYQLQNEFGPNGEPVWGALNDTLGQIRFVGAWNNTTNASGQYTYSSNTADYMEVTFYGTGLNILVQVDVNARGFSYFVDGGSSNAGSYPAGATGITGGRGYSVNNILSVVSNLSLGIHTVKVLFNGAFSQSLIMGCEILNESATLKVNSGTSYLSGKKNVLSSLQSPSYNSTYDLITRDGATQVSTSTRGGRVLVYQKSDATIGKAIIEANSAQANLTSANHTNEEIIRIYHFREFGAGRSDLFDFSLITATPGSFAFTLDDGTTSLVGSSVAVTGNTGSLYMTANGSFLTLTFVGTGLDISRSDTNSGGGDTFTYSIDGSAPATLSSTGLGTAKRQQKIVSGLPYGTHTVKIARSSAVSTYDLSIDRFIVYGPKKPTLPAGAVELADYNIMADFAVGTVGKENIATGVLRKEGSREHVYLNSWSMNLDTTQYIGGWRKVAAANSGNAVQYTFFGTGFEWRADANTAYANNLTVTLAAGSGAFQNLTAANFPTATFSVYGGITYASPPTLVVNASNANGSGFRCSGLPLGTYTIKITSNVATSWSSEAFDIITPIHSPKSNLYGDLQNSLPVGSCGISDNRQTTPIKNILPATKFRAQANHVTLNPTVSVNTFVPMPDMNLTVKSNGAWFMVSWQGACYQNTASLYTIQQLYVDGVATGEPSMLNTGASVNLFVGVSSVNLVYLSPGVHKVEMYWSGGGGTQGTDRRALVVQEL